MERHTLFRAWSEEVPPALVLHVAGEIDLVTAPSFKRHIGELIGQASPIIVDCSDLRFLDMSGIHVLEDCHQQADHAGQRLLLVGSTPFMHKIFAITQLHQRVPLFETMRDALKSIGQEVAGTA